MYSETSYYGHTLIVGLLVRKIFGEIENLYIYKMNMMNQVHINNHTYFNGVQIENVVRGCHIYQSIRNAVKIEILPFITELSYSNDCFW